MSGSAATVPAPSGDTAAKAPANIWVDSTKFNLLIGVLILANVLVTGLEKDLAKEIPTDELEAMSAVQRVRQRLAWYLLELFFCIVFSSEMLARMYFHKILYFADGWNCLDFLLVISSILDTLILTWFGGSGQVRLLSTLRAARILRLIRLVRMLRVFRELWLVVSAIINSIKALAWVGVVLFWFFCVCSIFATERIGKANAYEDGPSYDGTTWPHREYFGTVPKTMFTLFQLMTLQGWCDGIVRHVMFRQPYMVAFFLAFLAVTTFGLMSIVVGVIVENTLRVAEATEGDRNQADKEQKRAVVDQIEQLLRLSGPGGSSNIRRVEFQAACRSVHIASKLEQLGLSLAEVEELFDIIDYNRHCVVTVDDFAKGLRQLANTEHRQKEIVHFDLAIKALAFRVQCLDSSFGDIEAELGSLKEMAGEFLDKSMGLLTG